MIKEVKEIPMPAKRGAKKGKFLNEKTRAIFDDMTEFIESGLPICEITNPGYETSHTFCNMAHFITKSHGLDVAVVKRLDRVFLIRGDGDE